MASSVYFSGRTINVPGVYSAIDASALALVGLSASGIVACLGEAEGGAPYTADEPIINISNPAKVSRVFRAGDLREAGPFLFQPSDDPSITGGAQEVLFVKVNPATQATLTLPNADGDSLVLTSADYGLFVNQINATVSAGTTLGKKYVIAFEDTTETFDDVGGVAVWTALYTPGTNGATTVSIALDPTSGVSATFTKTAVGEASGYVGATTSTGLDADLSNPITAAATVTIVSSNAADTTQTAVVIGVVNGTGLAGTETFTLTGTTPVVGATQWSKVLGIVLSASCAGTITATDTGDLDVLFTLATTVLTKGVEEFGANFLEVGTSLLGFALDAAGTQDIVVIGKDNAGAAQAEKVTLTGTTLAATSGSWSEVHYLAIAAVPAARTLTMTGAIWDSGDTVTIVSAAAGDTQTATVYGLTVGGVGQSETLTLTGTTPVVGTATWSRILGVSLSSAAVGTITVRGASFNGSTITAFTLLAAAVEAGLKLIDNVTGNNDTVDIVADGVTTQVVLVIGLDETGSSQVEKVALTGTTPVTTAGSWSRVTALAVAHVAIARTLTLSGTLFDIDTGTYSTVTKASAYIDALPGWSVTVSASGGPVLIADMDEQVATSALTSVPLYGDLAAAIAAINTGSSLVTAEAAVGATSEPSNTTGALFLSGAVEGTTGFADWQAALDLLRDEFVNTITALTSDNAVHAAVKAHCVYMCGEGRQERDAVLGAAESETLTQLKVRTAALNTRHVRLCGQNVTRFNTEGEAESFPPYFTALLAAGMQAGSGVGNSLTSRYLSITDEEGDSTYTIRDDGSELIDSGLLMIETVPNRGFRWLRNVTTYQIDDNLAYTEASVNQAVNYAIYQLRIQLESEVAKKGFVGTVNNILNKAASILTTLTDPNGPFPITGWQNLSVEISGDVVRIDVEIAPVVPTNFLLITAHLVNASFAAAA